MERLRGEFHHAVRIGPGIQAVLQQGTRQPVDQRREAQGRGIDLRTIEEEAHAHGHILLHGVGLAQRVELLSPAIDLCREVDLGRTDIVAGATEGAGRHVIAIAARVAQHAQVDADRSRDEIGVAIACRTAIDGTGVHAGTTAHAFQRLPVFLIGQDTATPVVHQHDMHLATRTGATEMGGIDGGFLACSITGQEALEHTHRGIVGHEFLDTHGNDMQLRDRGRHISIALVGTHHHITRLGHTEISTRHAGIGLHELLAQVHAGYVGEERGVVLVGDGIAAHATSIRGRYLFVVGDEATEGGTDILTMHMEGRHHDMTGCQLHHLQDTLAQVGLDDLNATALQVLVEMAFLREHALALHHLFHLVLLQDIQDDGIIFLSILCPVHMDAILHGILLKLFQIPSKSTLKTVDDLGAAFRELIHNYEDMAEAQRKKTMTDAEIKAESQRIAKQIRSIISPLVIRRSRLDLDEIPAYKEDLRIQKIQTVIPEDPVSLTYNLGKEKDLYLRTLTKISPTAEEKLLHKDDEAFVYYKSARYKPSSYLTEDPKLLDELKRDLEEKTGISLSLLLGRQASVSDFMRKMLVRRFESSVAAFKQSLNSMIQSSESILRWIEKRDKIPVYKKGSLPDVDEFYETTDDDLSQEIEEAFEKYTDRGFFEIDMKYIKRDEYIADMLSDLTLLRAIREEWFGPDQVIRFDHKLDEFKKLLRGQRTNDPHRKIVVFTEFADTANYLGEALKGEGLGIFKYTSGDSSLTSKKTIRENFDAGLKKDLQRDDYQILIATDAISEGYNLHRAGTIFNYDIPYNPTRVIQRIGRINRINKKMFDKLYIFNYFPTDIGEQETRTKQISTLKMAMIHAIMGEDTKALTSDEQLNAFFKERYRKELATSEELSWDTKYRRILDRVKNTDIYQDAMDIPHRSRIGRNVEKPVHGVLLCGKKGNDFVFKLGQKDDLNPISISAEDALGLFEAEETEKPIVVSKQFEPVYQTVKAKLFKDTVDPEGEKSRREAYSIIKAWLKNKILSSDYLEDLLLLMRNDGLTGEEIRFINKLTLKAADSLPKKITPDYIKRCIIKMNAVDDGEETLILAEEIK